MSGKGAFLPVGAPAGGNVDASPAGAWWSPAPKLFAAAVLAVVLIWALDVSVLAPQSVHHLPSFYLGNFTVSKAAAATYIAAGGGGSSRGSHGRISATSVPQNGVAENYGSASSRGWITVQTQQNYTSNLISRWFAAGEDASRTADISVRFPASGNVDDSVSGALRLPTAAVHELVLTALDERGRPRGLGGDYFEIDLSGSLWKSRPLVTDHGNGSYSVMFQVHPDFAGDYNLTVVLLFRSFEGLKFSPERFKFRRELRRMAVTFYNGDGVERGSLPTLRVCRSSDFSKEAAWSGRWTLHAKIDQCSVDDDGRYRCLPPDFPCVRPWCEGPLGALESNGWVYSAHCAFRLFSREAAWKCLSGRWIFFWGDSNHVDTIRNLLNFVLALWDVKSVPRRFDKVFTNPSNGSETVRITSIFNGHWNETRNYLGLNSLRNGDFRRLLWKYFDEDGPSPDVIILNSGLHDGVYWRSVRAYAHGADYAARFWNDVIERLRSKNKGTASSKMPRVFYRTTIATGGYARDLAFNPSKMDAFNSIFVEKLMEKGLLLSGGVIDDFDMTFPWHYDNRCNDGVHYGRAPAKLQWRDGQVGHQYFVDLMLAHVLLNAICNE